MNSSNELLKINSYLCRRLASPPHRK